MVSPGYWLMHFWVNFLLLYTVYISNASYKVHIVAFSLNNKPTVKPTVNDSQLARVVRTMSSPQ